MDAMGVVRECAARAGKSYYRMSLDMGMTQRYIAHAIANNSRPRADTLARMLATCGYALCAVQDNDVTDSMLRIE